MSLRRGWEGYIKRRVPRQSNRKWLSSFPAVGGHQNRTFIYYDKLKNPQRVDVNI